MGQAFGQLRSLRQALGVNNRVDRHVCDRCSRIGRLFCRRQNADGHGSKMSRSSELRFVNMALSMRSQTPALRQRLTRFTQVACGRWRSKPAPSDPRASNAPGATYRALQGDFRCGRQRRPEPNWFSCKGQWLKLVREAVTKHSDGEIHAHLLENGQLSEEAIRPNAIIDQ
jgi:hypothetical protein